MRTSATIDQIVAEFLSEQSVSANSLATYEGYLRNFWLHCSANKIEKRSLRVSDLVTYRNHVIEKYSAKYATSLITVIKIFFKWLESKDYYDDVSRTLKLPKQKAEFLKEPLMDQEVFYLISLFDQQTTINQRDYLMIMFMLAAGLRCVEVSRINIGDIVTKRGQRCLMIQRKGHTAKDDFISIENFFKETSIEEYLNELQSVADTDPMFVSFSNNQRGQRLSPASIGCIINNYFTRANIKRKVITPHSLRHTSAVTLIRKGFSIDDIQMFLGHTKSEITKIYTRYANNELKLRNEPGNFLMNYFKNESEHK